MNRPRSTNRSLAAYPGLKARQLKGSTRYYLRRDGKDIALGDDLPAALERYHQLRGTRVLGNIASIADAYQQSERFKQLAQASQYDYSRHLLRACGVFGAMRFDDMSARMLSEYMKRSAHKAVAKKDLSCLSALWSWALEEGHTTAANLRIGMKLRLPKKEQPGVTPQEFKAVYDKACPELQDLLDILYLTGADKMVAAGLKRADIKDGYLPVKRQKTRGAVRIEVTGEFGEVIRRCLTRPRAATGPYIVQTDKGQKLTKKMIQTRVGEAMQAAGVHFELRALRRQHADDSGSLAEASERLGHASTATTRDFYRRGPKVKPLK